MIGPSFEPSPGARHAPLHMALKCVDHWAAWAGLCIGSSSTKKYARRKFLNASHAELPSGTKQWTIIVLFLLSAFLHPTRYIASGPGHCSFSLYFRRSMSTGPQPWARFITAADRQRVDAFFHSSTCCGFCASDIPQFEELLKASKLFGNHNQQQLLYNHLPPPSIASQNYYLQPRTHNEQLPDHSGHHLTD